VISATKIRFQHDIVMPKSTNNKTGHILNRKPLFIYF